jgi:hypothetical protein
MSKIWYHTPSQANSYVIIWSCASSLKEAGEKLAKLNKAFPDKSCDGQVITVGKSRAREKEFHSIKFYRLDHDKLKLIR